MLEFCRFNTIVPMRPILLVFFLMVPFHRMMDLANPQECPDADEVWGFRNSSFFKVNSHFFP